METNNKENCGNLDDILNRIQGGGSGFNFDENTNFANGCNFSPLEDSGEFANFMNNPVGTANSANFRENTVNFPGSEANTFSNGNSGCGCNTNECGVIDTRCWYEKGLKQGLAQGFANGYNCGFNNGKKAGYGNGFKDGLERGLCRAEELARASFQKGLKEGFERGYRTGYQNGFQDGCRQGFERGARAGFRRGYDKALRDMQRFINECLSNNGCNNRCSGNNGNWRNC